MAVFSIDDAVLIAVGGLVVKEGANLWLRYKSKKGGNGKNTLMGLLGDIRGQGKLTFDKVNGIEKKQGEMEITLKGVTTEMSNFKDKCIDLDKEVKNLDERIFDHIKIGG